MTDGSTAPEDRQSVIEVVKHTSHSSHVCLCAVRAEKQPPPPTLTQACLARVRASKDARYAVPAIGGVDPRRAEELLQHVSLETTATVAVAIAPHGDSRSLAQPQPVGAASRMRIG